MLDNPTSHLATLSLVADDVSPVTLPEPAGYAENTGGSIGDVGIGEVVIGDVGIWVALAQYFVGRTTIVDEVSMNVAGSGVIREP